MGQKTSQIRADIDPKSFLDLKEWANKQEGRSTRRHTAIVIERATRLWRKGSDSLLQMDATTILRELDLLR